MLQNKIKNVFFKGGGGKLARNIGRKDIKLEVILVLVPIIDWLNLKLM